MPNAPTPALGLVVPVHNEFPGSWDTAAANPNYSTLDAAIGGTIQVGVGSGTVNLTVAQAGHWGFQFTGALSSDVIVNFPAGVGGHKMLLFSHTPNGHGLYIRSTSDSVGVQCLTNWVTPLGIFVYPNYRVFWDYSSAPLGSVIDFVPGTAPPGWQLCDGHYISTAQFDLLYAYIGGTFGVSGATFAVPDLRGRVVAGADIMMGGASAGRFYNWGINGTTGQTQIALDIAHMPFHDHGYSQSVHGHLATDSGHTHLVTGAFGGGFGGAFPPFTLVNNGGTTTSGVGHASVAIQPQIANINFTGQGGGAAFQTVQPTMTLNKLIRC